MFQNGFPSYLLDDVIKAEELMPKSPLSREMGLIQYTINNYIIQFPYRIYYLDISDNALNSLSKQQRIIIHCIYSRSHDGFIREKHIKSLLALEYMDWAIPYVVKVCDEYVVEILETVYNSINESDITRYKNFSRKNLKSFCKSYARMISYWNEFYRYNCYHYHDYIGRKLFIEKFGYTRSMERIK